MKKALIFGLFASLSFSALAADKCQSEVFSEFLAATTEYDYHTVADSGVLYPAGSPGFESYGRYVELGYDKDVLAYHASNEYMSGYGAYEIIVDPATCSIIKMQEVYAE